MARHRRLLFLAVLATLILCGSGNAGGLTGFGRETNVTASSAATSNTRDAVLPYQTRPDVVSGVRRNDRDRAGRAPLSAVDGRTAVPRGHSLASRDGSTFRATPALTSGSRAPPTLSSFTLR